MDIVVDGKRVHCGTGGRGHDAGLPLVVMLHGAGMDHTVWALQTRYFAYHGYRVAAVDLPGHGGSEGPPLDTVEALGAWAIRLIEALGATRAHLVGHSMGALTALEATAQSPEQVSALAVLGASSVMPVADLLLDAAHDDTALATRLITFWGYGQRAHTGGMRAPGLWMIGGGARLLERCPAGTLGVDFTACNAYRHGPEAAAGTVVPTLVVAGARDRMTPAEAGKALAAAIDGAAFQVIADAGHMMMIEQPDATLDALAAFFRQPAAAAA